LNALRKRFTWLQQEHRRVILEAEQMQLNLENEKTDLRRTIRAREATIDAQGEGAAHKSARGGVGAGYLSAWQ
jgi:hypothetical protein